jgi:hypothetical protein
MTIASTADKKSAAPNWRSPWSLAPGFAVIAAVAAIAVYAVFYAPGMWQAAERLRAEQIGQEDKEFCAKFLMPPGSEGFATCTNNLAEIRKRHAERLAAAAAGIL